MYERKEFLRNLTASPEENLAGGQRVKATLVWQSNKMPCAPNTLARAKPREKSHRSTGNAMPEKINAPTSTDCTVFLQAGGNNMAR
jgi:hypothetical protein